MAAAAAAATLADADPKSPARPPRPAMAAPLSAGAGITRGNTATSPKREAPRDGRVREIDPSELSVFEPLGAGSFGTVYRGVLDARDVAIKKLRYASGDADADNHTAIQAEVDLLSMLSHPNIVQLLGVVVLAGTAAGSRDRRRARREQHGAQAPSLAPRVLRELWLVMEYVSRGSLFRVLHSSRPPAWEMRLRWAREIALGMAVMHAHNVLHRDLTSQNILVTEDDHIKLSDFGLSTDASSGCSVLRKFKPAYAAPEVWDATPYTALSDVFSYGVVLFELCTLLDPVTALRKGHGVEGQAPRTTGRTSPSFGGPAARPAAPGSRLMALSAGAVPGLARAPGAPGRRAALPPPYLSGGSLDEARFGSDGAGPADAPEVALGTPTSEHSSSMHSPSLATTVTTGARSFSASGAFSRAGYSHVGTDDAGQYTEHSTSDLETESEVSSVASFGRQVRKSMRLSALVVPSSCPYELSAIMQQCWSADPDRRPSAAAILELLPALSAGEASAPGGAGAARLLGSAGGEFHFVAEHEHVVVRRAQPISALVFAAGSRDLAAIACMDGTISVVWGLDVESGNDLRTIELTGHTRSVTDIDWALSQDVLLSASLDKTLRVWSVPTGQCLRIFYLKSEAFCTRFHPLNNNMIVVGALDRRVCVMNGSTGKEMSKAASATAQLTCLAFDQNGTELYVGDGNGMIIGFRISPRTGALDESVRELAAKGRGISSLQCTVLHTLKSQERLLLASCKDKCVRVYLVLDDGERLKLRNTFAAFQSNLPMRAVFCPRVSVDDWYSAQAFATGNESGALSFYDIDGATESGEAARVALVEGSHAAPVTDLSWSFDCKVLLTGDTEGRVVRHMRRVASDTAQALDVSIAAVD